MLLVTCQHCQSTRPQRSGLSAISCMSWAVYTCCSHCGWSLSITSSMNHTSDCLSSSTDLCKSRHAFSYVGFKIAFLKSGSQNVFSALLLIQTTLRRRLHGSGFTVNRVHFYSVRPFVYTYPMKTGTESEYFCIRRPKWRPCNRDLDPNTCKHQIRIQIFDMVVARHLWCKTLQCI